MKIKTGKNIDMKKWMIAAIILLLNTQILWAGEWLKAYSDERVTIYVFNDYKQTSEGYKIWTEWNFDSPQKIGEYSYISFKDYSVYSFDLDKTKTLTTTYYDKDGKPIESYTSSYSKWEYIIPGSVGNAVADFIADMIKYDL